MNPNVTMAKHKYKISMEKQNLINEQKLRSKTCFALVQSGVVCVYAYTVIILLIIRFDLNENYVVWFPEPWPNEATKYINHWGWREENRARLINNFRKNKINKKKKHFKCATSTSCDSFRCNVRELFLCKAYRKSFDVKRFSRNWHKHLVMFRHYNGMSHILDEI